MKKYLSHYLIYCLLLLIKLICSETSCHVEQESPSVREILGALTPEQLARFNNDIGIENQEIVDNVLLFEENAQDINNENNHSIRWESLIYFLVGTVALFLIARYGQTILETLFNIGTQLAQRNMSELVGLALNGPNREQLFNYTTNRINTLLANPETAPRVVNAFRRLGHHI